MAIFSAWWRGLGSRRVVLMTAIGLGLGVLGALALRRDAGPGGDLPTTPVRRGDLALSCTTVGELQAVRSLSLSVPRLRSSGVKIVWIVPEGTTVAPGDTLARFDRIEVQRRIEDLESRLGSARANLEKLRASQAARTAELHAAVEDEQAALRLAELNTENVLYEARVEQERAELSLQRAHLGLRKAQLRLEAQRTIDSAERTEQNVTISSLENELGAEREAWTNHVLIAPMSGLVVYGTHWSGGRRAKVKVGDQLYRSAVVLQLPDLSEMKVSSFVHEARVNQLELGLVCKVRVDAFPDTVFSGVVTQINALGRELSEAEPVKVFDYDVVLVKQDPRLRPGMTATVLVEIGHLRDVVYAPIETVHTSEEGAYVLRRRSGGFERVPVTLGRQNDFHVVLTSGVTPGDPLVLGDTGETHAE